MEQPIYVLIAVSISLTFAFSVQHPIRPPTYPVRILLLPEHYAPTLQNLQRDNNNSDNEVVPIPDGDIEARTLSHSHANYTIGSCLEMIRFRQPHRLDATLANARKKYDTVSLIATFIALIPLRVSPFVVLSRYSKTRELPPSYEENQRNRF
jgi:hypothetical protein